MTIPNNKRTAIVATTFLLQRDGIDPRPPATEPPAEPEVEEGVTDYGHSQLTAHLWSWGLMRVHRENGCKGPVSMGEITGQMYRHDGPRSCSEIQACYDDIEKTLEQTEAPLMLRMLLYFQYGRPHAVLSGDDAGSEVKRSVPNFVEHVLGLPIPHGEYRGPGEISVGEWQFTQVLKTVRGLRDRWAGYAVRTLFGTAVDHPDDCPCRDCRRLRK